MPLLFSVVIPTYNRRDFTLKAIQSCLSQAGDDTEVVVVDDCSTDDTPDAVAACGPPVRLVRQTENTGHWRARNTGVDHAAGRWCIFLDSDEELLPGALDRLRAEVSEQPDDIARLGFMYRYDHGGVTPYPPLLAEVVDYAGFVRWVGRTTGPTDFLPCTRRDSFEQVRYPSGRRCGGAYHLDFQKLYRTRFYPDFAALAYTRLPGRNTVSSPDRMLRDAASAAAAVEDVMDRHGEAVAAIDLDALRSYAAGAARWSFLAGRRRLGLRYTWAYLRRQPGYLRGWLALLCGLLGPRVTAWAIIRARRGRGG